MKGLATLGRLLRRTLQAALLALVPCLLTAIGFAAYSDSVTQLLAQRLPALTGGALRIGAIRGPLAGPTEIEALVFESESLRAEISYARLDWNLFALWYQQLDVQRLDVGTVKLTLKDTPPSDPEDALTQLPLALRIAAAKIDHLQLQLATGSKLQVDAITLRADWTGEVLQVPELAFDYAPVGHAQLDARLRFQPRALRIEQAQLHAPAAVDLRGVIGYEDHFEIDARWKDVRWPLQGEPLAQSAQGRLQAQGRWDEYRYALSADALAQELSLNIEAQGSGSLDALQADHAELQLLGGRIKASGRVAWSPQLVAEVRGQVEQIDPAQRWPEWPGRIGGSFALTAARDAATGFEMRLTDSQLRGFPFALLAQGLYRDERVELSRFTLDSGGSRLRAQGTATPPFALKLDLDSRDLGSLWPKLRGRAQLTASLDGTLEQPHVTARGEFNGLRYAEYSAAHAQLSADLHPRKPSHFDLVLQDLFAGIAVAQASLRVDGTQAQHTLRLQARTANGSADLSLRGGADAQWQRWQGELAEGRGAPAQLSPWQLEEPAALRVARDGSVALEPACWNSGTGRACVQLRHAGVMSRIAFRLEDWAFAYFASFLPPQWKLSGAASGTGLLVLEDGGIREARADLRTTAGRLSAGKQLALAFEPSNLLVAEEARGLTLRLRLPIENGDIEADALLGAAPTPAQRALSGRVRVALGDLTPLRLLSPELEAIGGRLQGEFALSGSAAHPRSAGAMRLVNGSARLATPGIVLQPLEAEIRSRADSDFIELSASATSGGGTLTLQGRTNPQSDGKILEVNIAGENFHALNLPDVHLWISPTLKLDLTRERADLSGEVRVPHADILPRSLTQGTGPSRDQVILGPDGQTQEGGLLKIHSNVRIVLGDEVRFEGFGLKSRLTGSLNAYDEPGRPTQARGEIRLIEGRYKAYGQDLSIETGRLLFNGGAITDPAIELRAVRRPADEITVGIYARGSLTSPEFSLYSTPAMPQDQQLSWLVLGRGIDETASSGERSAMSDAALSLGLSGGSFLSQKLGSGLSLDEVSIGSRPGQTSDQAQFTIGKYLSPKLFISYGIGVFQPGHTFRLLYDIGKHFKLSTESGVESGGDLLYTIER